MTSSLSHNGFTATIHYSAEDGVFFGKLVKVNDLVTFEGMSIEELKKQMQEAVDDYIETREMLS